PSVLTPHPLEAARLLGVQTSDVQHDRIGSAHRIAVATGACVVLKGAGTVVALPDGRWSVNASGGPILSVAGTGDVLAGTIAGLLAAGLPPADAAVGGTWLHGAAADALADLDDWRGAIGLPASRLPDAIRATLNRRAGRC
ncbi:MAG: ADP/ATP-dependent (S)-NAD(P)H-hydrate dehydratase, partial [Burkholderiales bacterium]